MSGRRKERVGGGLTARGEPSARAPSARGDRPIRSPSARAGPKPELASSGSLPDLSARSAPKPPPTFDPSEFFTRTGAPIKRSVKWENPWTARIDPNLVAQRQADSPNRGKRSNLVKLFQTTDIDDPEEFLAELQQQADQENREHRREEKDNEGLPDYNEFSRPVYSDHAPLRSLLLDETANNIPVSQSQSEFHAKKKAINIPHPSYDIDGDGFVGQEDLFRSKRFDMDGNGLLDPDEQEVGRFLMAQAFFKEHRNDLHLFGEEWNNGDRLKTQWDQPHPNGAGNVERGNIERLATAHTFQKMLNKLKETEKHYRDIGSHGVTESLELADKSATRHNFYSDKCERDYARRDCRCRGSASRSP